jgi:threonine dehydrogenase-like Zn-dependent dehydrogenase
MRAVVVQDDKRSLKVQDVPEPVVQPGILLLKTIYCSICGSDIEYLDGALEYVSSFEPLAGVILGHEWVAEVAAVGWEVKGWSVGDRVTYCPTKRTCGTCYFCRRQMYHLCLGGPARGSVFGGHTYGQRGGGMAEYFVKTPNMVQLVPENVTSEEACLAEPLATGVGSVQAAGLGPGKSAVVIGAGKIGLGAMLSAKAAGVSPIIVVDVVQSRLEKASEMGAAAIINARETDAVSAVIALTDAGPDAVMICVREGTVLNQAVNMVRLGGAIAITGFINPMEVAPALWIEKQLTIRGHLSGPVMAALNLMSGKLVDVRPLISEIMPLEDVQRGFDSIRSGQNLAVLLKP